MTHLTVDEAMREVHRVERNQKRSLWMFGLMCGVMISALVRGQDAWWHYLFSTLGGLCLVMIHESGNKARNALADALERREEWRKERLAELHAEEIAGYRETISQLQRDLEQHGGRRLN